MIEDHYWDRYGSPAEFHLAMLLLAAFAVCWLAFGINYAWVVKRDWHWRKAQKQARKARYKAYLASKNTNTNPRGTA